MRRIRFSSPGWDDEADVDAPVDLEQGRYARDDGARFTAVTLTCLSVIPAILLTAAFFLTRPHL